MEAEIQVKRAVKAGNSSAVILPRAWLNKEVRIELIKKTSEVILQDVLEILNKNIPLKSVIGIYLVGSYARGEEDENSDIDILVITNDIDKEIIKEGIYNILIASYQLLHQKMTRDLLPIGQMIKEAKPLLNSSYLDNLEIKVTKRNVKWYLDTTEKKLGIIQRYLENNKIGYVNNRIIYTLILRIRTLEIIKKLIENENYSKKDFIRLINKISNGKSAYEGYLVIKNDLKNKGRSNIDEAKRLQEYLKRDLESVKNRIGSLWKRKVLKIQQ